MSLAASLDITTLQNVIHDVHNAVHFVYHHVLEQLLYIVINAHSRLQDTIRYDLHIVKRFVSHHFVKRGRRSRIQALHLNDDVDVLKCQLHDRQRALQSTFSTNPTRFVHSASKPITVSSIK